MFRYISKDIYLNIFSCLQQLLLCPVKDLTLTSYEAKIERPGILQGLKSTVNLYHIQILSWALGMLVQEKLDMTDITCLSLVGLPQQNAILDGLKSRILFFYSSGGWKSEICVPEWLGSGESSHPGFRWSPCVFICQRDRE